ncbi:MAG: hypothetical protein RIR51_534 [Bacteroidota bacterium]|jgi:outer membrane receptor for ferrienterochelin and colicins
MKLVFYFLGLTFWLRPSNDLYAQDSTLLNYELKDVVISATMKEVSKLDSPIPVESFSPRFFQANPTSCVFEGVQLINGVRPQINCNICNTGDIHINGMEGPYTMVLIDGMPIVSGLSTVYGLNGIPLSLIERVEVVKGPSSTLFGSEAVGGIINVITKKVEKAPIFSTEMYGTSWGEINLDLSTKFKLSEKVDELMSINYFNYQNPIDKNLDNFTDLTLQHRISFFNKLHLKRKENRIFNLGARYIYEDRWGGEMEWNKNHRGGDQIYGESIYTQRSELFGLYQLPTREHIMFQFSGNFHHQNSYYGTLPYLANQKILFGQFTWYKSINKHDILTGLTYRYTYLNDNTPISLDPINTHLPGLFIQDEIKIKEQSILLIGSRFDYNSYHGKILSPRISYKWNNPDYSSILRIGIGNGFRVANVFTEDHTALTGAREVIFREELNPERSWNGNINFEKNTYFGNNHFLGIDATLFYTYFHNKILANYDIDPNKIIYENLNGFAISKGISLKFDLTLNNRFKSTLGSTFMQVYSVENAIKTNQILTENFSATWNLSYEFPFHQLNIDYTGNLYGPMRLPLLSPLDPRKEFSPWWSIQNFQLTQKLKNGMEIFGGIKNLLNWTPNKNNPFIIARAHDPFDKNLNYDNQGKPLVNEENPYGLSFDPSYVYGPNQGRQGFIGIRYSFN